MPQFDIFSFFSQLFWVFLGFTFLFLILSLYILPAIAAILKTRKRKLEFVANADSSVALKPASLGLINEQISNTIVLIDSLFAFNVKANASNPSAELQIVTLKFASSRKLCLDLLNNVQLGALFYV